jgi:hypothetical protein
MLTLSDTGCEIQDNGSSCRTIKESECPDRTIGASPKGQHPKSKNQVFFLHLMLGFKSRMRPGGAGC